MSWFSSKETKQADSSDPAAGRNFWPVTAYNQGYGQLSDQDTEWACETGKGFRSETQTWYSVLEDGSALMVQVIWSNPNIVFVSPTTQMTFMLYDPKTKQTTWKSVNVGSWKPAGRSGTSDHFEIRHSGSASGEEAYHITAKLDQDVQLDVTFTRPANMPGCKLGSGAEGGYSYLGGKDRNDAKRDGSIVHRFHPLVKSSGHVIVSGKAIDVAGEAMFVHAIQAVRPDSAAARWNFAFFSSKDAGEKLGSVRAIQMEFTTTDAYGPKGSKSGRTKVNVGMVYASARSVPLLVVGETQTPPDSAQYDKVNDDVCSAVQSQAVSDKDTGYAAPGHIVFKWAGQAPSGKGRVEASVETRLGQTVGDGGLIEKKNVLAELPYPIRKVINATGTKPFIYQYHNPTTLQLSVDGETTPVQGWLFSEASFVSQ